MSRSKRLYLVYAGLALLNFIAFQSAAQVTAGFMVNYQSPNCAPTVVSFVNTSTGSGLSYEWNFGTVAGVNSTQQNPSTTFLTCGTYTVSLKATNSSGQSNTVTQQVTIDCEPIANFTVSQITGCSPVTVTFNSGIASSGGAAITSYQWDFGDGYGSSSPNPTHTYTTTGCKSVTLVITNANGCIDDTTIANIVCPTPAPVADFTSTSPIGCAYPFNVTYTAAATGAAPPYTYAWTFNGGTPATSTTANPAVAYSSAGSYWTQLIVTDANGCKDTIKKFNYVVVASSATNFSISATTVCAPATITTQALNQQFATAFSWTCTGGTMASTNTPDNAIYFPTPGSYNLCLTMTFPGNCTATKCTTIVVNPSPVADFTETGNNPTCQPPLTVSYTNASTGSGLTYQWQLPGTSPSTSTQANPSNLLYNGCGNFDATLIVTNSAGCKDTLIKTDLVNIDCPLASFMSSSINGCYPLDVTFNSTQSTGSPTQWFWNFGDTGNPNAVQSTQQNPSHTFATNGCYDIRLIIVNAQGCRDTTLINDMICVGVPPTLSFTASPTVACAGVPITFTNTSTNLTPWNTFKWDFIDPIPFNTMSTAKNPTYTYQDTGFFDVTLISCHSGCCDTLTIPDLIYINPPVAKVDVVKTCASPFTAVLHGENSMGATSYSWSIPGASPSSSTDSIVVVNFPTTGTYTANLTVFNSITGCSHSAAKTIQVRDVEADFYMSDTAACAPHQFCFNNTSQDGNSFKWAVYNSYGLLVWTSTTVNPCVTFTVPGIYSTRLIAYDVNGCTDTMFIANAFKVYGLVMNFSASNMGGCAPFTTTFNGTVLPSPTSLVAVSYQWDFGDPSSGSNNFASIEDPSHTYNQAGLYSIVFTVVDEHGCVTTRSQADFITVQKPDAQYVAVDSSVCLGSPVCFTNQSTGNQPVTYAWTFSDGGSSAAISPCYQFTDTGWFSVSLIATDNGGCTDTITRSTYVHVIKPTADFSADTTQTTCPPLAVTFTNSSLGTDPGTTYFWDFGDGVTSTAVNPYHIYTYAGNFDVTLILTTSDGCQDTLFVDDLIKVFGPVADVDVTPTFGCTPAQVCFNTVSGTSASFTWNFGDGTVVTGNDSVCHTYTVDGIYLPQVILNDGVGCVYALPLDTVKSLVPEASFTASPYYLCQNGLVQFTDSSTSETTLTYNWNFNDPASGANDSSTQQNPSHTFNGIGNYLVDLTVTNTIGCSSSYTDTIFVTGAPLASFVVSDSTVCPSTTISFTNTTTSGSPISGYQWNFGDPASGAANTSTDTSDTHLYSAAGAYTVTLTVASVTGCTSSYQKNITVYTNPIANAGPDKNICIGDSTTLIATGGVSYNWNPSTNLSDSTTATVTANPTLTTVYVVNVIDSNGCTAADAVTVTVNSLPIVNAGSDVTICPSTPAQLLATGASTYQWSPNVALTQTNIAGPSASPSTNTTYVVVGTSVAGCTASDTVVVNVFASAQANAGIDTAICSGDTAQLNGTGGVAYSWSPTSAMIGANTATPKVNPALTTTYTLTVTSADNCTATDNVVITVNPLPVVDAGVDQTICQGTTVALNATGALNYLWNADATLTSTNVSNPIAMTAYTHTYFVTGTDNIGCSNMDSVVVNVIEPFAVIVSPNTEVCYGEQVQLSADGGVSYEWSPSTALDNPYVATPYASPTQSTTYTVVASDGVCFQDIATVEVTVNPLPQAYAGEDVIILAGETVVLTGTGSGNTYSWTPAEGLSCSDCANPEANPNQTTTYVFTISNDDGCRQSDTIVIMVGCKDDIVFIPNAFSPNGDAVNDVFYVRSKGLQSIDFLRVFDRWGNLIFESKDVNVGWDGTYKGKMLAPGTYVYYLQATCSNGQAIMTQGNVALIR